MKMLSISEAARIKGCTRAGIHAAIESGRLTVYETTATLRRIRPSDLAKLKINPQRQVSGRTNGKRGKGK